ELSGLRAEQRQERGLIERLRMRDPLGLGAIELAQEILGGLPRQGIRGRGQRDERECRKKAGEASLHGDLGMGGAVGRHGLLTRRERSSLPSSLSATAGLVAPRGGP